MLRVMGRSVPVFLAAFFIACVLPLGSCAREKGRTEESAKARAADARKAPSFSLPDLAGNTVNFSDYKGKVVLVDFWATWCGPCKMEVPHLVDLYEQYRGDGFEIIGIALDRPGAKVVGPFAKANNMTYSVLIGNTEVANAFGGLRAIPTAFLIDRSGVIVKKYVGYQEKAVFEGEIKKLL